MAQYGNSEGRNRGKKYTKLTGNEIATPEAERKAKRFLDWYGAIHKFIEKRIRDFDPEIGVETMLRIYNDILYKPVEIKNYKAYFIRAYFTTKLKFAMAETEARKQHAPIEELTEIIPAPDFDYEKYEETLEQINQEILEYVRKKFKPMDVSIFEIYLGLQPDVSYVVMGEILGISANRIYLVVSAIKRDLQENMAERRNYLLSKL